MKNKELYEKWKATAKYSDNYKEKTMEEQELAQSTDKFFAASEETKVVSEPEKEQLGEKYIKQFRIDMKTPGTFLSWRLDIPNPYMDPMSEKLTTNAVNDMIMSQSFKKMAEMTGMPPKLTTATYMHNVTL